MKKFYLSVVMAVFLFSGASLFSEEKTSVELTASINWTFGSYKESSFSNISQVFFTPRIQLETKITRGNFMHKIIADYFFTKPNSSMTDTAVVYKTYDPVTGEEFYQASVSSLSFHRIKLQYDLSYGVFENQKFQVYAGGFFACNAYLQFENYPSITGLFSLGPVCTANYIIDERNSLSLTGGIPLIGFGVRPPFAGCSAELMKYAEENFLKIFTLGNFLSIHNYQSIFLDFTYNLKATEHFSTGMGLNLEYSRIAQPSERPLYYVDSNFKVFANWRF